MCEDEEILSVIREAGERPVCEGRFAAGTVFGDWRITAFIGRGGNGEVYCAEHVKRGTPAAVKILVREDERARKRFAAEARLLSRQSASVFPRFFGFGEANGAPYLAMELLESRDLPSRERAVARFMLAVCGAVAKLHALGYVHRDIKPGNILWRGGKEAVLADLGLAKSIESPVVSRQEESLTVVDGRRMGAGTPGYGAPEQMERGEATAESDIHALGVLADRCFGGRPPRAWKRIIERATSSIPSRRYSSVSAMARAIRRRHLPLIAAGSLAIVAFLVLANGFSGDDLAGEGAYERWYLREYGEECVQREALARKRGSAASSKAGEISRMREAGEGVGEGEYVRLEDEYAYLMEQLKYFRERWKEVRRRNAFKFDHVVRAAAKTKPVTIQLLEMYEKSIRDCLDERPPSNSD